MIPLDNTGDTVIMLLVAAGVGLLGGVAAGLLEIRRDPKKAKKCWGMILSSIFLGGVAAVAILYFFPPEEVTAKAVEGTTEVVREYNLTKLVALALIVGSAGASFLLILQKRTIDLAVAKEDAAEKKVEAAQAAGIAKTIQVQAQEEVKGLSSQAPLAARASVTQQVEPVVRGAIQKAVEAGGPVTAETVASVVEGIGDQTEAAVADALNPLAADAHGRISATAKAADLPTPLKGD